MKVIDSSVIIKFFSKEPGWMKAKEHLAIASATIELAVKELGNALWKKVRRNEIALGDAFEILTTFPSAITVLDQRKYMKKALEIAVEHEITIYDSIFIAVAVENAYEFITCDKKQKFVADKLGVKAVEC